MGLFTFLEKHGPTLVRDPVCGKQIPSTEAKYSTAHLGRSLFFCSPACKFSFKRQSGIDSQSFYMMKREVEKQAKRLAIKKSKSGCQTCHVTNTP